MDLSFLSHVQLAYRGSPLDDSTHDIGVPSVQIDPWSVQKTPKTSKTNKDVPKTPPMYKDACGTNVDSSKVYNAQYALDEMEDYEYPTLADESGTSFFEDMNLDDFTTTVQAPPPYKKTAADVFIYCNKENVEDMNLDDFTTTLQAPPPFKKTAADVLTHCNKENVDNMLGSDYLKPDPGAEFLTAPSQGRSRPFGSLNGAYDSNQSAIGSGHPPPDTVKTRKTRGVKVKAWTGGIDPQFLQPTPQKIDASGVKVPMYQDEPMDYVFEPMQLYYDPEAEVVRTLNEEETVFFSRQHARLARNRTNAHQRRESSKLKFELLEERIATLEKENSHLKSRLLMKDLE